MFATVRGLMYHVKPVKRFVGGSKEAKGKLLECYNKYHNETS